MSDGYERFSENDLYLIRDNYKKGNDDFVELFIGDREFVVPYSCTVGSKTNGQSVARFRAQLFDFQDAERRKYNEANKRVKCIEYDGMKFVVPFGYSKEINAEEIALNAIEKANVKYNMIINAHRELKKMGVNVGEISFYDYTAEKYNAALEKYNKPSMLNEKTPNMVKVLEFLDAADKKRERVVGKVTRVIKDDVAPFMGEVVEDVKDKLGQVGAVVTPIAKEAIEKGEKFAKKEGAKVVKGFSRNFEKIKNEVKKKITEIEFKDALKYVPKGYKVAMLAAVLASSGVVVTNVISDRAGKKDKIEKVANKKKVINKKGEYLIFNGEVLKDKYGNLAKINDMREDITKMLFAVEGFANGSFKDGKGVETAGGGNTIKYDEKGIATRVGADTYFSDKEAFIQKWRYIEKELLPIISTIDRECSPEVLKATIGAGFCWGPTALSNSNYFKGVKEGASLNDLTRKLTGFRKQKGLLKREYLLACVLNGKWSSDDLANMPVYYIQEKGFLHCAIYTIELNEICSCKKDAKGNYELDKQKNMIPIVDKDDFITLHIDRAGELLNKLTTPNPKYGTYMKVCDLIPNEFKDYFNPYFSLSQLQEKHRSNLSEGNNTDASFEKFYAMANNKVR